ncbi:MAG: hypothetical protein F6K11_18105 [Leptolyngbya sp. SIO3F4]|nr:hypothetical protein [Leptolyngbya sp. SIO3F4]
MTLTWKPPRLPNKKKAVFSNTAEYAAIVHNGATLRDNTELPARPWMTGAFGERNDFNVVDFYVNQFKRVDSTRTNTGNTSIAKSFRATAQQANKQIKLLITSPIWNWPRITIRKGGKVARSPRDIVNTGNLRRQQQPVRFES